MQANSIFDYLSAAFPPESLTENTSELRGGCPWCPQGGGDVVFFKGHAFVGRDRLVTWKSGEVQRSFCRACNAAGRGRRGIYLLEDYQALFGLEVDALSTTAKFTITAGEESDEEKLPDLIDSRKRIVFHHAVDAKFWHDLGFTDETINHFQLGFGKFYTTWNRGHLIPMRVRTAERPLLNGDYYEARIPVADSPDKYDKKNSAGSKKAVFWEIAEGKPEDGVVLTESPKDALALWQMGYRNIITSFGAGVWSNSPDNFAYLKRAGYSKLILTGDHDSAGEAFNKLMAEQGRAAGLTSSYLNWTGPFAAGYDTSDLLKEYGAGRAKFYIEHYLVDYEPPALSEDGAEFIPDFREIDPLYLPRSTQPISLEEVRGDGPRSLKHIIREYLATYLQKRVYGRGIALLLAVRPGAGKTHALIQVAEEVSLASLARNGVSLGLLNDELKRVKAEVASEACEGDEKELLTRTQAKLQVQVDSFSFRSVFWGAQYKNSFPNLVDTGARPVFYFVFQARGEENCQNYPLATRLAVQGHSVMRFCVEGCPFAQRCKESGYLAQYPQRLHWPIGIYRHEHLPIEDVVEGYKDLIIIDESPLHVIELPVLVNANDCLPGTPMWENDCESPEQVEAMQAFAGALADSLRFNQKEVAPVKGQRQPNFSLSGAAFLRLLDISLRHRTNDRWTLADVMAQLDEAAVRHYQPNYIGTDITEVQPIRLPQVYLAIERELDEFLKDPEHHQPSCLHLVSGTLEVYRMERIKISSNVPIIIADATAMMPELYEIAFGRDLEIYAPDILNPQAEVVSVYGSDWTISHIERSLGALLRQKVNSIVDAKGQRIPLDPLWNDSVLLDNKLVMAYLDVIMAHALKHKKDGLLVVLHKRIRAIIEPLVRHKLPHCRIAFAHFGAIRGTNQWQDYAAVLLLGTPRIPYDVLWRRVQAWASLSGIVEPIPFELNYLPDPYDGTNQGHTHLTFSQPFARRYVNLVELGEAIQAQERIRPHSTSEKKSIYLYSSRPIGLGVTRVEGKTKLMKIADPDSKLNAIAEYVLHHFNTTQTLPSKRDIMKSFHCGLATVNAGLDLAKENLTSVSS